MRILNSSSFLAAVAMLAGAACGGSEKEVTEPARKPEPVATHETKPAPTPTQEPTPPPVAESPKPPPEPTYTYGRFVWYEHWAKNEKESEKARKFYSELFGWNFQEQEMAGHKFNMILAGGVPIGLASVLDKKLPVKKTLWMGYISVPNVDVAAKAVTEQGGKVILAPMDLEGVGRFGTFQDPQGAIFGIVKTSKGDMPRAEPKAGELAWMELWTKKPKESGKVVGYYSAVIGYQGQPFEGMKDYTMLAYEGTPYAGVNKAPQAKLGGNWIPYVRVNDVDATIAQAKKLKGKLVDKARDIPNVGRVAVIADPSGAMIGLWMSKMGEAPADKAPAGEPADDE
jgi:predicted enzyme related to lactoylglutathione lyase